MKVLLTLDYELFLDDVIGTVDNSLIKPMKEFNKVCAKHGVRATIFVDAAYLYMLNKLRVFWTDLQEDYDKVVENIKWLEQEGHDIELHIHPQWYYSTYDENGWHLDWGHYKLSSAPYEESLKLFTESKELLDSIIGRKTIAFRAGGYSIQQFNYQDCFERNGILADSSVLVNNYMLTDTNFFDFRGVLHEPYRFTADITRKDDRGRFKEYPISVGRYGFIQYMVKKRRHHDDRVNRWGDGGCINAKAPGNLWQRLKTGFRFIKYPYATIDYDNYSFLEEIHNQNTDITTVFTIIGHPKLISSASMIYLNSYIDKRKKVGDRFVTIRNDLGV